MMHHAVGAYDAIGWCLPCVLGHVLAVSDTDQQHHKGQQSNIIVLQLL